MDSISAGMATLLLRTNETIRIVVPVEQLPGVGESDIISAVINAGQVMRFSVETEETDELKVKIKAKLDKLKNRPRR